MIKLVTDGFTDIPVSVAGLRISSLYESYGCKYDFLRFYKQIQYDKFTALISLMDGHATVCKLDNSDDSEMLDFLSAVGAKTVYAEYDLPLETIESGSIMHKTSNIIASRDKKDKKMDFKRIYNIMSTSFAMPDFNVWYPDISHRIRHGCAAIIDDDNGCAVALKSTLGALITGICVTEDKRRNGYGSYILNEIISVSGVHDIFALVEKNGTKKFYEVNEFSQVGKFSTYKVK